MDIRIFTLPFDPILEGFPDEQIADFCLNKRVHRLETQFFQQEGRAYWSVAIHYEQLLGKQESKRVELDEAEQRLFDRLRDWRKEQGHKDGIPVYLIATNQQLLEIVRRKTKSAEALKDIKGFGKGKIERYGKQIAGRVKAFFDEKGPEEAPSDMPF